MTLSIKAQLEAFSDKQLENELSRRMKERAVDYDTSRIAELGEPSVKTYMALRYPDQNRPFADKFRKWFTDTYVYDKKGYRKLGLFDGGGFIPETGQNSLTVAMFKDKSYTRQLAVEEFVPHMLDVTLDTDQGKLTGKFLDVMEHTLSEDGAYWIGVFKTDVTLYCTTYGRTKAVYTAESLREVLKYVWTHHWHE